MSRPRIASAAQVACFALTLLLQSTAGAGTIARKLVHHGWDVPSPVYAREHVREMEKAPFDGTTIAMRYGEGRVFSKQRWSEQTMAPEIEALAAIEWRKFTDNYLMIHSASEADWTRDEDWDIVLANVRLLARAAQRGRLLGLCLDPEPYGKSPWNYRELPRHDQLSFAEYQEVVRRRGRDFLRAIVKEMPAARILTFFQLSVLFDAASRPVNPIPDCAVGAPRLEDHAYALLPAFLFGMLDAAQGRVQLLDGNELAYYYTSPEHFYRSYHGIRSDARCLLPADLSRKYELQVGVAQAIFIDEVLNLRGPVRPASQLAPREQLQWLEQNVYYALAAGDGTAWIYSEQMNWWTRDKIPAGAVEAIERARLKLDRQQPLGFDMSDRLETAKRGLSR